MQKFGKFIVKHRIFIIITFTVLIIPAIVGSFFVKTNYDMLSYLPDELNSVKGNEILSEEFGLSDTIYILVHDEDLLNVSKLKNQISSIDGVKDIIWVDNYTDLTIPESFIPSDIKERFLSGKSTILQIQLSGNKETDENDKTIENIKNILNDKSYLGGQPALTYELKKILDSEKIIYFLIGAVAIFIILSLSTSSLIEPGLLFVTLGVAILLNMGTNAFIGSISYNTSSIAAIIQLAVSVDYSIFLLHRYREEKQKHSNKEDAMVKAISGTGVAVTASALTTIAGFSSLLVMKIAIGKDLGFVLAKGVLLSLLTTIILLPCLILITDKLIEKSKHRIFMPRFNLVSGWVVKGKWFFLILTIVLLVPSFLAQRNLNYYSSLESSLPQNAQSVIATEKIKNDFGSGEMIYVVAENQDRLKESQLINKIKNISVVRTVTGISSQVYSSIPDTFIPNELTEQFRNSEYSYFIVQVETGIEDKETIEAVDSIEKYANEVYGKDFYITGESVLLNDMYKQSQIDMKYVNYLSIGLVALIIALSFRSLSIPIILIAVIQLAIWLNLSIPFISGKPVYFLTSIFIGAIQLGTTVDYAILLTSRYKENLVLLKPVEAMKKTIKDTGQSIITSALILFGGTLGITIISQIKTTSELTNMIGRGALLSMAIIFFGLPALLLVFERIIGWTTLGWKRQKRNLDDHKK